MDLQQIDVTYQGLQHINLAVALRTALNTIFVRFWFYLIIWSVIMIVFEKPIGAHADCKELEYISALHQSGPMLRQDASISGMNAPHWLLTGVENT